MEDKQKILDLLLPALQATRNLADLVGLEYRKTGSWCMRSFQVGIRRLPMWHVIPEQL